MTGPDPHARPRRRDSCASRPGAVERAVLERMEELRALVDEYEELLRWARVLGYSPPGDRAR